MEQYTLIYIISGAFCFSQRRRLGYNDNVRKLAPLLFSSVQSNSHCFRYKDIENNVCSRVTNVSALTRGLFWCLFPELRSNEANKYQNNTRVSAETVPRESTYIIIFLTRHNESINDSKNDELYTSSPCLTRSVFVLLMTSQSLADDITMTRQLWCDHVNNDI